MKKILLMLALAGGVASAHAQSADTTAVNDLTLKADIYPQQEDGDLYHGLSRKLTFDRMIPPYGLEVTYDKTTHIIFPSAVRYVDLRFSESDCGQGGRFRECNQGKGYQKELP